MSSMTRALPQFQSLRLPVFCGPRRENGTERFENRCSAAALKGVCVCVFVFRFSAAFPFLPFPFLPGWRLVAWRGGVPRLLPYLPPLRQCCWGPAGSPRVAPRTPREGEWRALYGPGAEWRGGGVTFAAAATDCSGEGGHRGHGYTARGRGHGTRRGNQNKYNTCSAKSSRCRPCASRPTTAAAPRRHGGGDIN